MSEVSPSQLQQLCLQKHVLLPILSFLPLVDLATTVSCTCKAWRAAATSPQNRKDDISITGQPLPTRLRLERLCASPLRLHVVALTVVLRKGYSSEKEITEDESMATTSGIREWPRASPEWLNAGIHWQLRRLTQALPRLRSLDATLHYSLAAERRVAQSVSAAEEALPLFPTSLRSASLRVTDDNDAGDDVEWSPRPSPEQARLMWQWIVHLLRHMAQALQLVVFRFLLTSQLCRGSGIWMRFPAMAVFQLTPLRRLRLLSFKYEDDCCEGQAASYALIRLLRSLPRLQHFEGATVNAPLLEALSKGRQDPLRLSSIGSNWPPLNCTLPVMQALIRLPFLTRLTLSLPDSSSGLHLLPQLSSLRQLDLKDQDKADCDPDELVNVLTQCKQITALSLLHKPINELHLSRLLSSLHNLRSLRLGYLEDLNSLSFLSGVGSHLESLWLDSLWLYPQELLHIYELHCLRHLRLTCVVRMAMEPEWWDRMFKPENQTADSVRGHTDARRLEVPSSPPPEPLPLVKYLPHLCSFMQMPPETEVLPSDEDDDSRVRAADEEDNDMGTVAPLTHEQQVAAEDCIQDDPPQLLRFKISNKPIYSENPVGAIGEEWDCYSICASKTNI